MEGDRKAVRNHYGGSSSTASPVEGNQRRHTQPDGSLLLAPRHRAKQRGQFMGGEHNTGPSLCGRHTLKTDTDGHWDVLTPVRQKCPCPEDVCVIQKFRLDPSDPYQLREAENWPRQHHPGRRGARAGALGGRGRGNCCSPVWPLAQQPPHWEAGAQHCFQGPPQQHPPQCGGIPQAAAD